MYEEAYLSQPNGERLLRHHVSCSEARAKGFMQEMMDLVKVSAGEHPDLGAFLERVITLEIFSAVDDPSAPFGAIEKYSSRSGIGRLWREVAPRPEPIDPVRTRYNAENNLRLLMEG